HLDDGGGGDYAEAQSLGDGQLEAGLVGEVDIEEEGAVALLADEGDAQVADGRGEVVGYRLDDGAEGVHVCGGGVGDIMGVVRGVLMRRREGPDRTVMVKRRF